MTLDYLRRRDSEIILPASGPLSKEVRLEALRLGRSGVEHPAPNLEPTTHASLLKFHNQETRDRYLEAFDKLLDERLLASISVDHLVRKADGHNTGFYNAFPSGIDGVFCCWAARELDEHTNGIRQLFDIVKRDPDRNVRSALQQWMERVSSFVMKRPNGRLQIPLFLVHELDKIGAFKVKEMRAADSPELGAKREKAVDDLVAHAAAFHRAGARSIFQLQQLFLSAGLWDKSPKAIGLWSEKDNCSWNLALSFWQAMFTCLFAVGVMDAEHDAAKHRDLIVDIWYRGAFPPIRRRERNGIGLG